MSDDDELRRRLQDIPAPRAGLDAEAIVAGARKRRRPKTIALSSAATVAGVLIVAPLVTPGLSPLLPRTSGDGVSMDSGAAPEMEPEPAPQEEGAGGATDGTDGAEDAGSGDSGASGTALGDTACAPAQAGDAGLALRFLDDPSDGTADLAMENLTDTAIEVRLDDVGSVELDAEGRIVAAGVWPGRWATSELAAYAGSDGGVTVDLEPRVACAQPGTIALPGAGPGIAPVATVLVTRGGEDDATAMTVVGEPFDVR